MPDIGFCTAPTRRDLWNIRTGLRPGYYDCDTLMLRGCMALLCRYVEDESGGIEHIEKFTAELLEPGSEGHGPRAAVEGQANSQGEAAAIYRWWKHQRRADKRRRNELVHELYGRRRHLSFKPTEHAQLSGIVIEEPTGNESTMRDELWALDDKISKDEQAMLHRLVDIRQSLWT